jgi:hypothetical protein
MRCVRSSLRHYRRTSRQKRRCPGAGSALQQLVDQAAAQLDEVAPLGLKAPESRGEVIEAAADVAGLEAVSAAVGIEL